MRILFFLAIAYFSAIAWAGGYAGCLERVMFFQAYEIDGLLPTGQTIGYKCVKWDFNKKNCKNNQWVACEGDSPGQRCTFKKLISQIDPKAPNPENWPVYTNHELDAKKTALNCLKEYKAREKIPNIYPSDIMLLGNRDYKAGVTELGKRVDDRWKAMDRDAKEANRPAFTAFDNNIDEIIRARRGDTGVRMYNKAVAELEQLENVTLKVEDLGDNPDPDETDPKKKRWKEVKWVETQQIAVEHGIEDGANKVKQWVRNYILTDPFEKPHRIMIKGFKAIVDGRNLCR
ncbi:hypothetical protein GGI43DRAFT_416207 [Trichoderma evansii]